MSHGNNAYREFIEGLIANGDAIQSKVTKEESLGIARTVVDAIVADKSLADNVMVSCCIFAMVPRLDEKDGCSIRRQSRVEDSAFWRPKRKNTKNEVKRKIVLGVVVLFPIRFYLYLLFLTSKIHYRLCQGDSTFVCGPSHIHRTVRLCCNSSDNSIGGEAFPLSSSF